MDIYTIGHSNYTVEKLIDMLKHYDIDCVVDIRGTPYSKYNVQYNLEAINHTLRKAGFVFIYMGEELAAKRKNKVSYNSEGYSDFEKVVTEESFIKGVNRLKDGCNKGYKIALLGAMQDPIRCHRSILVGRELIKYDFNVKHILDNLTISYQDDIDEMVINKYYKNGVQISLIDDGNIISREDMINEGYRKANKEIGYRIENLDDKK